MTSKLVTYIQILWPTFGYVVLDHTYTAVAVGNNLVLNVTYENKGGGNVKVEWRNNRGLIIERSRNGVIYRRDTRTDIEMGSNLILRNTSLYDN